MKVCKKCGINERIHQRTICQPCKNEIQRVHRSSFNDGYFYVYMLPYAKYYVGQTCNLNTRMEDHRSKEGNDTTDYWILHKCSTRKESLWFEKVYHKIGFPGEKDCRNLRYRQKKSPLTKRRD